MLINAFSFLPFRGKADTWQLVSDQELVKFIRVAKEERERRLLMPLEEALGGDLKAVDAPTCALSDPLPVVIEQMKERPCLVLSKDGELVGIVTAFDLL
jgi:CBS domain-containing protein